MTHAAGWFLDNGIGVFPIKPQSKEPNCKSWDDFKADRAEVDGPRFNNYGVILRDWFGVIDTDAPEAEAWVSTHVPHTPFTVKTARGIHRYFRMRITPPKFLHRDGLTIEFRNQGQYVVGPGSVNPTGAVYTPAQWSWRIEDVPMFPADFVFDDRPGSGVAGSGEKYEFPESVCSGERHDALFKLMRGLKALGNDKQAVRWCVTQANQNKCSPPLKEDSTFERWFNRGWDNPDRPLARLETNPFGGDPWATL